MLFHHGCMYFLTTAFMVLLVIGAVEFTKLDDTLRRGICAVYLNGTEEIKVIWNLDNHNGTMTLPLTQNLINFINNGCYTRADFTSCPCWLSISNPNYINLNNDNPGWIEGTIFCIVGIFADFCIIVAYTIRQFYYDRCCQPTYRII